MKRERNNSDEEDYDEEPIPKRPRKSQAMLKRDTPRKSEAFKAAILPDTPENTSDNTAGLSVLLADINKKGARVKILETSLRDLEEEKDTLQDEFNELYEKHEQLKRECTEVVKLQEALAKARGERELISVHYKSMEARLIECSRENDELKKNDNYKYRFICEDQKKSIDAMDAELQTARTRLRQDGVRLQQQVALYKRLFYAALVLIITLAASWSWTSLKVDNPVELSSGTELKYKKQLNNKHFTLVTRANTYTNITVLSNSNRMGLSVYNTRGWYASDNSAHGVLFDRYTVMDSLLVYTAAVEELSIFVHCGIFGSEFAIRVMPEDIQRLPSTLQVHVSKGFPYYAKASATGIQRIRASCVSGTTFLYASAMDIPTVSRHDRSHTETSWVGKVTERYVEIYNKKEGADWIIMLKNDVENDSCRIELK